MARSTLQIPSFRAILKTRSQLVLENIALRQQLAVLKRENPRSKLNRIWIYVG